MQSNDGDHFYSDTVRDYLLAMEQRDLAKAQSYLAPAFTMTFPGGVTFTTLDQLIDWARGRYQHIGKTIQGYDVCTRSPRTTVYCHGMLAGRWLDGSTFTDIRFIDRFVMHDGKIADQWVYNDLAEMQARDSI